MACARWHRKARSVASTLETATGSTSTPWRCFATPSNTWHDERQRGFARQEQSTSRPDAAAYHCRVLRRLAAAGRFICFLFTQTRASLHGRCSANAAEQRSAHAPTTRWFGATAQTPVYLLAAYRKLQAVRRQRVFLASRFSS